MTHPDNEQLHEEHAELQRLLAEQAAGREVDTSGLRFADTGPAGATAFQSELGHYRLLRVLGHGGQGVVYLAEDTRLGREVALKLLSSGGAATPGARARFRREALAASRLRHPGICTVHEAGEIEGQRFLAMEFVDGGGLSAWISERGQITGSDSGNRRSRVDRALEIVEQIARAVQAAHDAGIVHRDLKPANIRLRADGSPVVLDFGLARDDSEAGQTLTMAGDVLGTPAYLPPERVRGETSPAAAATDVYGLGTVLYECLTGRRAFDAPTRDKLYHQILTAPVDDPRRHDPAIPREARFVVETALDKVPERRYATAAELADDLARLRARQPIRARPVPVWLRAVRWVQADPRVALPTIGAFAVLLVGITVSWMLLGARNRALVEVEARALVGDSAREMEWDPEIALRGALEAHSLAPGAESLSQIYEILANTHGRAGWQGFNNAVDALFVDAGRRVVTITQRGVQVITAEGEKVSEATELQGIVSASLDATRRRIVVGSWTGTAHVLSALDASPIATLPHDSPISSIGLAGGGHESLVQFAPEGDTGLILTGAQGGARLWRLHEDGPTPAVELWRDDLTASRVTQIMFSPDGRHFAAGEQNGTVRVFATERAAAGRNGLVESEAAAEVGRFQVTGIVRALAFDPARALLAAGSDRGGKVRVWTLDGKSVAELATFGTQVLQLRFAPGGSWLAACDNDRSVHLWRATDRPQGFSEARRIVSHEGDVITVEFAPDGRSLLTASRDETARIFDLEGRELARFGVGLVESSTARFSTDGRRVVTTCWNGTVRIFDVAVPDFPVRHEGATVMRVVASDRFVVATRRDGGVVAFDRNTGARHELETGADEMLRGLAMSADGQRVVCGDLHGIWAWDLSGARPVRLDRTWSLDAGTNLSADPRGGHRFVTAHRTGAKILDLDSPGQPERIGPAHDFGTVAWGPDGVVSGIGANRFYWDIAQAERGRIANSRNHGSIAASPDGAWLAFGASPGFLRRLDGVEQRYSHTSSVIYVLDRRTRERRHMLTGHGGRIPSVAFSPDSRLLASVSRDRTARLWDVKSGEHLVTLRGHRGGVVGCTFTPDGQTLITTGTDGTLRWWPVDFDKVERMARERTSRRIR